MSLIIKRELDPNDIPRVEELLMSSLGRMDYTEISRLGGLTNHTYKVTMPGGGEFAVRIPGDGTEEVINRQEEKLSTELACKLGIDAELIFFDDKGGKVSEYIENASTLDARRLRSKECIKQCADIFGTLHGCGEDTGVEFDVFKMASSYEDFIREHNVSIFDDYEIRKEQVRRIRAQIEKEGDFTRVPCHNDPLCENWVEGNGRMYLIDWEYAGMNDGMWDIAATSIEAGFNTEDDQYFLKCYLGRSPQKNDKKHLLASKVFVDYLWTLWAKMRVPFDGQPMEDWAEERYARMNSFIDEYDQA